MEGQRWFLPFMYKDNIGCIDTIVRIAEQQNATLVVVSLLKVPQIALTQESNLVEKVRSENFLEMIKFKADQLNVPLERYEAYSCDVVQSLKLFIFDLHCTGIVLTPGKQNALLPMDVLRELIDKPPVSLVLIPSQTYQEQKVYQRQERLYTSSRLQKSLSHTDNLLSGPMKV